MVPVVVGPLSTTEMRRTAPNVATNQISICLLRNVLRPTYGPGWIKAAPWLLDGP
jgi:hypothetical protein